MEGNYIKGLRQTAGITQNELAKRAGVDIRRIQRLESGEIQAGNLTLTKAIALAAALGVSVTDLIQEPADLNAKKD